ncbi:MAG: hypothetical protein ABR540_09790, partial [Acidimicrobiales bacterium]
MTASPGFEGHEDPVRPEILAAFARAWAEIARPGTWWDGLSRLAIAGAARAARSGDVIERGSLPQTAVEAASLVAARPAAPSEAWVSLICDELAELRYVELVGIVARVMAVDTFHRLAGWPLVALPEPVPGPPTGEPPPANLRRHRTWVAMAVPVPPSVLGAVPAAMRAVNELSDVLYMPPEQMADPDWRRGDLHRA